MQTRRHRFLILAGASLLASVALFVFAPDAAAQMSRVTTEIGKVKAEGDKIYSDLVAIAAILFGILGLYTGYLWWESKGSDKAASKAWITGVLFSFAAVPFFIDCAKGCAPSGH